MEKPRNIENRPLYPCGYRPCRNLTTRIIKETENTVLVYCEEHKARTLWNKIKPQPKEELKVDWQKNLKNIMWKG